MADPVIKIKRSAVAGKIPTPDQLPLGEVALNTYDGYLYASKNVGIGTTVIAINPFRVGTGTDSYNAYFTAGNIGIGSTLPTSKLSVVGDVNISGVITASSFIGNLTGTATNSDNINISATSSADTFTSLVLVADLATGNQSPFIDSGLYYNASSNILYTTTVSATTVSASTINVSSAIDLADNDILRFGTSDDWEMYHNTSGNFIDLNTGNLIIRDDGTVGDPTRFTLGRTSGDVTTTGDVYVADNKRIYFGTGSDLAIFHNSTNNNSVISELGSGNLNINATEHTFNDPTGSETKARFITNGAVELYYDNVLEFETTGYGATVYGTLQSQQVNVSGIITASSFYGDGANVTGISTLNIIDYGVGLGGGGASATVAISTVAPSSPSAGDLWYNSILGRTFIYYNDGDSSQWVDSAPFNIPDQTTDPVLQAGKTSTTFAATQGQKEFVVSHTIGYVDVYLNGVRLSSAEFAEDGSKITLADAASSGDVIDVVEYRLGIGDTGPQGPASVVTIGTRAGAFTQNLVGAGFTISLRSGIATVSF